MLAFVPLSIMLARNTCCLPPRRCRCQLCAARNGTDGSGASCASSGFVRSDDGAEMVVDVPWSEAFHAFADAFKIERVGGRAGVAGGRSGGSSGGSGIGGGGGGDGAARHACRCGRNRLATSAMIAQTAVPVRECPSDGS
eukprot:2582895-Pleurochrysis_carterae.AAC.1